MQKGGLVRKTFFFSALLILVATGISFLILYFAMPSHYLRTKEQTLGRNLNALTKNLATAQSEEESQMLLARFASENNVQIISQNAAGDFLPSLSSPFINMMEMNDNIAFYSTQSGEATEVRISESGSSADPFYSGEFILSIAQSVFVESQTSATLPDSSQLLNVKFAVPTKIDVRTLMRGAAVNSPYLDRIVASATIQPIDEAKGVILSLIPFVLIVGFALGLMMAWFYARKLSRPILQISAAARQMQTMEPDTISGIRTKDELGQLSSDLDALYASLRKNIEELQTEMKKVSQLERAKTEMMQSASHELKTPIAALSGMLEGMIDNVGAYKDKETYLRRCMDEAVRLSALVGEILSASKAADGELLLAEVAVDELLAHALKGQEYLAERRELRVVSEIEPLRITTDESLLGRVFNNLVSNAVHYTSEGGEIRVTLRGNTLILENDCPPIPEEEIDRLFEPFYTREYSRDKSKSGNGLGLYIVRQSLERLHIPYKAASTESGFRITLTFTQ